MNSESTTWPCAFTPLAFASPESDGGVVDRHFFPVEVGSVSARVPRAIAGNALRGDAHALTANDRAVTRASSAPDPSSRRQLLLTLLSVVLFELRRKNQIQEEGGHRSHDERRSEDRMPR